MAGSGGAQRFLARCLASVSNHLSSSGQGPIRRNVVRVGDAALSVISVKARSIGTTTPSWQIPQLDFDALSSENNLPPDGDDSVSASALETKMAPLPDPVVETMGLASVTRQQNQLPPVGNFDLTTLVREMSTSLSNGRMDETIHMFEEWVKGTDITGQANKPDLLAYNLLLHAKLRVNAAPEQLLSIVVGMEDEGLVPNLLTYNFLLRAVFRSRNSEMAERILQKMVKGGPDSQPDGDSYNFVIALCALERRLDAALSHMQAMLERGFTPSKVTYNELLVAAARLRRTRVAVHIMKELKNQSAVPVIATCAELAGVASEVDDAECALLALQFMSDRLTGRFVEQLLMDEGGVIAALNTAARTGNKSLSDVAWDLLCRTLGDAKSPSAPAFLGRIHCSSAAGDLTAAFEAVSELEKAHGESQPCSVPEILSPFSSLQPLVRACCKGGPTGVDAAYFKLEESFKAGNSVSLAAVNSVILGCSKIWDADRAYQTFDALVSVFGLRPNVHSCNALLDAFGKSKRIAEVLQIWGYMQQVGVSPDNRSFSLLIEAHVVNRDLSAAFQGLNSMVSAGHTPNKELLVKLCKRCQREGDDKGLQELGKTLGPELVATTADRRNLLSTLYN